jgi:hypothetical protein
MASSPAIDVPEGIMVCLWQDHYKTKMTLMDASPLARRKAKRQNSRHIRHGLEPSALLM